MKAEESLGERGEEHQPAGEHRLHDRQRCDRERADVKQPRWDRDQPPDRKPLGAKESSCMRTSGSWRTWSLAPARSCS
jgi:hypothetical protein